VHDKNIIKQRLMTFFMTIFDTGTQKMLVFGFWFGSQKTQDPNPGPNIKFFGFK
jgi:hypothetical protein